MAERRAEQLSENDVERAIARIEARDPERGRAAHHVYDTLTWGEGPGVLSQSGLQSWLWYQLSTKYLTDEPGYQQRLAHIAAELFDELRLDRYAAICRSDVTAGVHAAFEQSDEVGYRAMRKALESSGIEPPDVDGFIWGGVMGIEEATARSTVEHALEAAITDGRLRPGAKAWREFQTTIVVDLLDGDHPTLPGQSLRSAIDTERATGWRDMLVRRSPTIEPVVDRVLERALIAPTPPAADEVATALHPLLWLLERIGDGQAMTAAGYLNRPFIADVWAARPWTDELLPLERAPRSESDDFTLHTLRQFGQQAGLLRVAKKVLRRTKLGDRVVGDPAAAWPVVVAHLGAKGWERFIAESAAMFFLAGDRTVPSRSLSESIAQLAADVGWRTDGRPPTDFDVARGFRDTRRLLALFAMLDESGDWSERHYTLTTSGTALATAIVHTAATGPRSHP